jgi:S1-C subfamily serine protease
MIAMMAILAAGSQQKPPAQAPLPAQPSKDDDNHLAWARQVAALPADPPPAEQQFTPDALFARCSPSVVQVQVQDHRGRDITAGSGFVVAPGLVVTNLHVLKEGHTAHVVFSEQRKLPIAGLAAINEEADLAILKVYDRFSTPALELAGRELPAVGTKVYAIGNPQGLANTLSDGLVSGHQETPRLRIKMIQTTAPISPGSSGGPLFQPDGKVIGVTTLSRVDGQNLNFAVPAFHVTRLIQQCKDEPRLIDLPLAQQTNDKRGAPAPLSQSSASGKLRIETLRSVVGRRGCFIEGTVYNDTGHTIEKLRLHVKAGGGWERTYEVTVQVPSYSTKPFSINTGQEYVVPKTYKVLGEGE